MESLLSSSEMRDCNVVLLSKLTLINEWGLQIKSVFFRLKMMKPRVGVIYKRAMEEYRFAEWLDRLLQNYLKCRTEFLISYVMFHTSDFLLFLVILHSIIFAI